MKRRISEARRNQPSGPHQWLPVSWADRNIQWLHAVYPTPESALRRPVDRESRSPAPAWNRHPLDATATMTFYHGVNSDVAIAIAWWISWLKSPQPAAR